MSTHEIDSFITLSQLFLSISFRSNPLRPISVLSLAMARFQRHLLSNQREDLDMSIFHLTDSILLLPHPWLEHGSTILQAFFVLVIALVKHSLVSRKPNDAIYAAIYLRHLRGQPQLASGHPRHAVTRMLVEVLALQIELEANNIGQNINEMAVLCGELLTSDVSEGDIDHTVTLFSEIILKIRPWDPDLPLDQVIECLQVAKKHQPHLLTPRFALALRLGHRHYMTSEEFIAMAQEAVAQLAWVHSMVHKAPEYSEEAIYRARDVLSSSHEEHRLGSLVDFGLNDAAKQRFDYFGSIKDPEASSSSLSSPLFFPVPAVDDLPGPHQVLYKKLEFFMELLPRTHNNDIDEASIEKSRTLLASSAPRDPSASVFFGLFGPTLFEAFCAQRGPSTLTSRLAHFVKFGSIRCHSLLLSQIVNDVDRHANLPNRSQHAMWWAFIARDLHHPSVSTAYESAIIPLPPRMTTLIASLDYVLYRIDLHQLEEAIVTLDTELKEGGPYCDLQLGHKFAAVNRDLEELTKSIPPSHKLGIDDDVADDLRAVDPFGRLLLKQRGLLKERDNLISKIQALPGFDSFLTSPSFDTLRSAASSGPIIIINHSRWRSDILILLHNTSPSLIPTPHDFYDRANALKDKLLDSQCRNRLESSHYDETLTSVLVEFYNLVGKPVIDRLCQLQIPEQFRIWWCPTSVFCSLPLHAMGPIPSSDDGELRYFLDLYICSYTPTLSALIQSRSLDKLTLLLVAQPDPSIPTVGGEIQAVQALDAEAGKPFEAGFELYDGERLILLEIVRFDLPTAEFAFLSACHTAEVTERSIVDEILHLAAPVQYCGFRSVVGTMWAMADDDGQELAK
ncbi:hypothetical protein EDB92DRAFT_2103582 [Lactarius akahatsu]|uniref:CHAT domain-containing protein n=1 Tax=Lactarius akahatsu TaxID=416441 RepID=A0AAD4QDS0_9AGAM|nr:hypothetical protein EDB92DRAFT_2103582 [Lactarius akahatsu]